MDFQIIFYTFLLGAVSGITQLLPISSIGHLIFLEEALHFKRPPGDVFEIGIQLGAALALCWFYRHRAVPLFTGKNGQALVLNLLIAFLPIALFRWMFHGMITEHLFHLWAVALTLFLGGVAILGVETCKPPATIMTLEALTPVQAFVIGLFQALALIPGVSRLAASLLGGLLLGIERRSATEFSFLLAVPTLCAASLFDLCANRGDMNTGSVTLIILGSAMAFISAASVIRWCVSYLGSNSLRPFGWYRVLVGGGMLAGLLVSHWSAPV